MHQHSHVIPVNDRLRPDRPVRFGPQSVLIPRRSFEQRVAVWERGQQKLTLLRDRADAGA